MLHKAFVLKAYKQSESNLIVHSLNEEGCRLSMIARGAVKSKKRFAGGVLEPSHLVLLQVEPGKSGLFELQEATLLKGYEKIRDDYEKLDLVFFFLNTLYKISQSADLHSHHLFNILGHSLEALEAIEIIETSNKLQSLKMHFILRLLYQQGVLDAEDWMRPWLKVPIKDNSLICENLEDWQIEKLNYIIEKYVAMGEVQGNAF